MQENVKKCKNFLATLIKLASHNSPSPETSKNVKALVQDLLVSHENSVSTHILRDNVSFVCLYIQGRQYSRYIQALYTFLQEETQTQSVTSALNYNN